ncbi:MAG: flippase-like domain-containing protein, partial [Bdellovibrionales bacterium]|nr:flippase-like domain-containing protein [Bdellovibrionales bacterium]
NLLLVNIFGSHFRWVIIARSLKMETFFLNSFPITLAGTFSNYILPIKFAGDLTRATLLSKRYGLPKSTVTYSIVWDRFIALYSTLLITVTFMLVLDNKLNHSPYHFKIKWTLLSIFAGTTMALFYVSSLKHKTEPLKAKIVSKRIRRLLQNQPSVSRLLTAITVSVIAQLCLYVMILKTSLILKDSYELSTLFLYIAPLSVILSHLPIIPIPIGSGQILIVYLFKIYSDQISKGGVVGLSLLQATLLFLGLCAIFSLLFNNSDKRNTVLP